LFLAAMLTASLAADQQRGNRPPLSSADIDAIAQLVMLEDTRTFDEPALVTLLRSRHPEVRRRAVVAVARIVNPRGFALLTHALIDPDPEVVATVAFAAGQLKDAVAVPWLRELLTGANMTRTTIAREAAIALGKIQIPESKAVLEEFLTAAPATSPATAALEPVVGEALLSIGRFPAGGDLEPIVKWVTSPSVDVRWRATWALLRPRDPASVPHLLKLADDTSGEVRSWAVRGLAPILPPALGRGRGAAATPPPPPPPPVDPETAAQYSARLRAALTDSDRRVRTEALRALGGYDDDASFEAMLAALDSPDTWMSISAAEGLSRKAARADVVVPKLVAAAAAGKPVGLRVAALLSLERLAPERAIEIANALAGTKSAPAQTSAAQVLQRLKQPAAGAPQAPPAPRPTAPVRTIADYRRIVERWIVPDYNGAPRPRAIWTFSRGEIEIELHPGDAPLGVEYFVSLVESGAIVGTEFGRLVPDFVAQQRTVTGAFTLRDEVSRLGLTRANLSWASAGLDTGRPGYTLGHTPQPHNEGNFTALGRVVRGMEVVDRLEFGDAVTATRIRR